MGKRYGVLGITFAAFLAVGTVASAQDLNQDKDKEMLGDAFFRLFQTEEQSGMEQLFGWSEMENALKTTPSKITVGAEVVSEDQKENADVSICVQSDPTDRKYGLGMDMEAGGISLGFKLYADEEKLQAQVPDVAQDVLVLPFRKGIEGTLPEESIFSGSEEEVNLLCTLLGDGWDLLHFDIEAAVNRFEEQSDACEKLAEDIRVSSIDPSGVMVDGEIRTCDGYQVIVNGQKAWDVMTDVLVFIRDDEVIRNTVKPWLELSLMQEENDLEKTETREKESTDMETGTATKKSLTPEEFWDESLDSAIEEWKEVRDEVPTEQEFEVYVYDSQIAQITAYLEADAGGFLYLNAEFNGGAYRTQNGTFYLSLDDSEGNSEGSIYLDKSGEYDDQGGNVSWTMMSNDGTEEEDQYMRMDASYDAVSGEIGVAYTVEDAGEPENNQEMTMNGKVTSLEKGRSIALRFDDVNGHVNGQDGSGSIFYEIRTNAEAVKELEGPQLNVLTATQNDFMNYIMKFGPLIQQIEEQGAKTETELQSENSNNQY